MARPARAAARLAGASLCGERHRQAGQPCCDALLLVSPSPADRRASAGGACVVASPRPDLAGFVICDGAGGSEAVARGARRGSQAVWRALLGLWAEHRRRLQLHSPNDPFLWGPMDRRFLARVQREAGSSRQAADHTALGCLWDRHHLLLARVGDSGLLLRRHGRWQLPLPPQKGRYPNQTQFLRPGMAPWLLGLSCIPAAGIEAVIGFSDGLEAAFLAATPGDPDRLAINEPLAELVLRQHHQRCGWRGYPAWLARSLADPGLARLGDDDRSLVIACR